MRLGGTEFCRPLVVTLGKRRRLTEESKDEVQLLLHRGAGEEGPARGHLVVNAAHAPAGSNGQRASGTAAPPRCPTPGGSGRPGAGVGGPAPTTASMGASAGSRARCPLPFHSVGFVSARPAPPWQFLKLCCLKPRPRSVPRRRRQVIHPLSCRSPGHRA